jgi:hypothetical protein
MTTSTDTRLPSTAVAAARNGGKNRPAIRRWAIALLAPTIKPPSAARPIKAVARNQVSTFARLTSPRATTSAITVAQTWSLFNPHSGTAKTGITGSTSVAIT